MIKNKLKLSLAAAMVTATCSYSGTLNAPNSKNIDLSGDIELKFAREKSGNKTVQYKTAEVNLALKSELKNGTKIITELKIFDGTQGQTSGNADDGTDDGISLTTAYAVIPFMVGKAKVIAGLAPNDQYGIGAFDNGGEDWKLAVNMPVFKGVKVTVVSKVKNEEKSDNNKGDSGMTAIRVDAKFGDFMVGAKYGAGYANKGDGKVVNLGAIDEDNTEKKVTLFTAYTTGEVSGLNVGLEYTQKNVDLIGTNNTMKPKGYFVTVGKTIGDLNLGLSYINLSKGMKGGEDFAPGMILDGNIDSSPIKDTNALVLPIEYVISEKTTASATFISADIKGDDAREIDVGVSYTMDDSTELSVGYGNYTIDNNDNKTNIEIAIAITF